MRANIPAEKQTLLDNVVAALKKVPGVTAIALGGSFARGTQTADSDLDIGLYYRDSSPFRIDNIRNIALGLSASGSPTVTEFYEWGPFVNGGAWIDNGICKIDFLYRSLDQLERTVNEAEQGRWEHSFDQQPPFGFRTVTTLGELFYCLPLFDSQDALDALKARVASFPPALKAHVLSFTLRATAFTFVIAKDFAAAADVPNSVGCMTRIFHYLVHALFALNDTYLMNEKRIAPIIATFEMRPDAFYERVTNILAMPGATSAELADSLRKLTALADEIAALAGAPAPRLAIPGKS